MELWMLLWVRRIPHAERSLRFRLSPGEVKNPRFEAGDGHMLEYGLFHRHKEEVTYDTSSWRQTFPLLKRSRLVGLCRL